MSKEFFVKPFKKWWYYAFVLFFAVMQWYDNIDFVNSPEYSLGYMTGWFLTPYLLYLIIAGIIVGVKKIVQSFKS